MYSCAEFVSRYILKTNYCQLLQPPMTRISQIYCKIGIFGAFSFNVRNSTLLHLPPLRFHCVGGCWDRSQDCCDIGIHSHIRFNHSAIDLIHTLLDLIHSRPDLMHTRLDLIHSRLDLSHSRLDLIHCTELLSYSK